MHRILFAIALVGLLGCFIGTAGADDDQPRKKGKGKRDPEAMFKRMDSNGDGKVSKDEFTTAFEKMRERRAAKGKGGKGKPKQMAGRIFDKLDANSDGYLTMDEFKKFSEMRGQFKGKKKKKNNDE